jgi:hypothetical protein
MFKINFLIIATLICFTNLSLAERSAMFGMGNFLTIERVDTEDQIGRYGEVQFQHAEDGRWDLISYQEVNQAQIDTLSIEKLNTFPEQILLHIKGQKTKACGEDVVINKNDFQFDGITSGFFKISINLRPQFNFYPCVTGLSFERTFPLDIYGLYKGNYQVFVNNKTASFELTLDNK